MTLKQARQNKLHTEMNDMKKSIIIQMFLLGVAGVYCNAGSSSVEKDPVYSMINTQAYVEFYRNTFKTNYENEYVKDLNEPYKSYVVKSRSFVADLMNPEGLDLQQYVTNNVNDNPYPVMASAFFLYAFKNAPIFPVPDNYSLTRYYQGIYGLLKSEFRKVYFEYIFAYYRSMAVDVFSYHIPPIAVIKPESVPKDLVAYEMGQYMEFWRNVRLAVKNASEVAPEDGFSFITDVVLCRLNISRPLWDESYAEILAKKYLNSSVESVSISEMAQNVRMIERHYNSEESYLTIYGEVLNIISNAAPDILKMSYMLRDVPAIGDAGIRDICGQMSRVLNVFCCFSPLYQNAQELISVSENAQEYFANLDRPVQIVLNAGDCRKRKEFLLTDAGCLDYDSFRLVYNNSNCANEAFWGKWYKVVSRRLHKLEYVCLTAYNLLNQRPELFDQIGAEFIYELAEKKIYLNSVVRWGKVQEMPLENISE
jgi:hypothetical protein